MKPTQEQIDKKFAALINLKCSSDDPEQNHLEADAALCALLRQLGFKETLHAWLSVEPKWYA